VIQHHLQQSTQARKRLIQGNKEKVGKSTKIISVILSRSKKKKEQDIPTFLVPATPMSFPLPRPQTEKTDPNKRPAA
jgi:hypothetical protein